MLRARLARLNAALVAAFEGRPPGDDERQDLALPLADVGCRIDAIHALEQQVLAARIRGTAGGQASPIAPSIGKLLGTECKQLLTEIGLLIAGPYAAAHMPLPVCRCPAAAGRLSGGAAPVG